MSTAKDNASSFTREMANGSSANGDDATNNRALDANNNGSLHEQENETRSDDVNAMNVAAMPPRSGDDRCSNQEEEEEDLQWQEKQELARGVQNNDALVQVETASTQELPDPPGRNDNDQEEITDTAAQSDNPPTLTTLSTAQGEAATTTPTTTASQTDDTANSHLQEQSTQPSSALSQDARSEQEEHPGSLPGAGGYDEHYRPIAPSTLYGDPAPSASLPYQPSTQEASQELVLPQAFPVPDPPQLQANVSTMSRTSTMSTSQQVVQAQPLEEWDQPDDDAESDSGEENEDGNDENGRKMRSRIGPMQVAIGIVVVVIIVVVGAVVGVTQATKNSDSNGDPKTADATDGSSNSLATPNPTNGINANATTATIPSSSSSESFPPFSTNLHFLTLQAVRNAPSSPQARANAWMMQDPQLNTYSEQRQLQRFALATIFFSTSGNDWARSDDWLSYELDECLWYNAAMADMETSDINNELFPCDENYHILNLNLSDNGLNGLLPVELFFFPALTSLDLSFNGLRGTAPTMFAGAQYLQRMVLSGNRLTGQFTAELGFVASRLKILQNDANHFTGAVPGLLRLLPNLQDLNITDNQYTGTLPGSLSILSNSLKSFEVGQNFLTGSIPTELSLLTRLEVLDIGRNADLRGIIPTELASLTSLTAFNIMETSISGGVPPAFCALEQSGQLVIAGDCDEQLQCCS